MYLISIILVSEALLSIVLVHFGTTLIIVKVNSIIFINLHLQAIFVVGKVRTVGAHE